jgi:hypothetical protein
MAIIGAVCAGLVEEAVELPMSANQDGERWAVGGDPLCAGGGEDAATTAGQEAGATNLRGAGQAEGIGGAGAGAGCFAVVARAMRYQRSQTGMVQRKSVEVILTKQISMSVARMRRARAARTVRERVA